MGAISGRGGQRGPRPQLRAGVSKAMPMSFRGRGGTGSRLRSLLHPAQRTTARGAHVTPSLSSFIIGLNQEGAKVMLKDQTVTILGLVGHLASV